MPPLSLLIKPASGSCNYRCRYCFYADVMAERGARSTGMMSLDTLKTLVRRALVYGEGQVTFGFQGGEPTLAGIDFFRALIDYQKQYARGARIQNCLQTNGGLINDEWAEFFYKNDFLVGLSMDGERESHDDMRKDASGEGTYGATRRAAELLRAHGAQFNILCVVNKRVARRPRETYAALKEYQYLQFIPCIDDFNADAPRFSPSAEELGDFLIQTYDLYERDFLARKRVSVRAFDNYVRMLRGGMPESCGMGGRCSCNFAIEYNGDAYPCDFYMLDEWKLGNVRTDSFTQLIGNPRARQFINSSVYISPECKVCRHYALCRGGCRRDREPFTDGHPSLTKYCEGYRAFFDARAERLRALAAPSFPTRDA